MNYNLVQTTYFLIFVIIAITAYIAAPVAYQSFADASDTYVHSQMKRIQAEMFFVEQREGSFKRACYTGTIGFLVQDLIQEYGKKVVCKTNYDNSKMIIYAKLKNGYFHSVGSDGVSCDVIAEPLHTFQCKKSR